MAVVVSRSTKAEDLQHLQSQVDKLRERLDFIGPMLPFVNFVKDYFEKVECEASVQLVRLKSAAAHLDPVVPSREEAGNSQLEFVKWCNAMTNVAISTKTQVSEGTDSLSSRRSVPVSTSERLPDLSPRQATAGVSPCTERRSYAVPQFGSEKNLPGSGPALPPQSLGSLQCFGDEIPALATSTRRMGEYPSVASSPSPRTLLSSSSQPALPSSSSVMPYLSNMSQPPAPMNYYKADVSPSGQEVRDGLVLGKGSWATAYRQAEGVRLDALRLLCTCGIVTARELSDDLTVISQEHINECVLIASDMLRKYSLDTWGRRAHEAKRCFEAQLTALYQKYADQNHG